MVSPTVALFSHSQLALGGQLVRNAKEAVLETGRSPLLNRTRSQDFLTVFARDIPRLSISRHKCLHITYILPNLRWLPIVLPLQAH